MASKWQFTQSAVNILTLPTPPNGWKKIIDDICFAHGLVVGKILRKHGFEKAY